MPETKKYETNEMVDIDNSGPEVDVTLPEEKKEEVKDEKAVESNEPIIEEVKTKDESASNYYEATEIRFKEGDIDKYLVGAVERVRTPKVQQEMISVFPKPERMFPKGEAPKGGDYLNPATGEVLTDRNVSSANIKINPDGKPSFKVSDDNVESVGTTGKGNSQIKTNLFKKKAGWKWTDTPSGMDS